MCCKVFFFLKRNMFLRIINQIQEKTYIFILFIKQFSVFDIEIIRFVVNNGLTTPFKEAELLVSCSFIQPCTSSEIPERESSELLNIFNARSLAYTHSLFISKHITALFISFTTMDSVLSTSSREERYSVR